MGKNKFILIPVTFVLVVFLAAALPPRGGKDSSGPMSWNLGGGLTARFSGDDNHGYVLTVEGSGALDGFASPKDAPWYSKSGRVSKIVLSEGITSVGGGAFAACGHVDAVVLPRSVTSLGEEAFAAGTKICAYGQVAAPEAVRIYQYSEDWPEQGGYYWHQEDGGAAIWETTKILFIGNSFTYTFDIDQLFAKLARGAGKSVVVERITIGAHNLSQFADPQDKGGAQVEAALAASRDYDIIVLQEQSTRPVTNYDLFLEGARSLQKKIEQTQDHCQIYLYATWGFPAETNGRTIPEMEAVLRAAYADAAKELGVQVSNVGAAFTAVYQEYPEIGLYSGDQRHPSYAGSYLSACVHAATLLGIDPRESGFDGYPLPADPHPGEALYANDLTFDAKTAEILRDMAYSTVFGTKK